jgi:hypothetical protein
LSFKYTDEADFEIAGEPEEDPDEEPKFHIAEKNLLAFATLIEACVVTPS